MKMFKFTKLGLTIGVFSCTIGFTSCDDQNFDFEKARSENAEYQYNQNFQTNFGSIDPNQSWDFFTGERVGYTRADEVVSYDFTQTDWKEVDMTLVNDMKKVLTEGDNHQSLGNSFVMAVPGSAFTIYPIYQGSSMGWELHMVVKKPDSDEYEDIKFWQKGQDIQKKTTSTQKNWTAVKGNSNREDGYNHDSDTMDALEIRSKGYRFENLPFGQTMYFYVKLTHAVSGYGSNGDKVPSTNDMMRALYAKDGLTIPTEYTTDGTKKEIVVIGVEDCQNSMTDHDYNDMVFMIVGDPYVPQEVQITEGEIDKPFVTTKRYMVEDMGYSDGGTSADDESDAVKYGYTDIDFNDIVVDFSQVRYEHYKTYEDKYGNYKETRDESKDHAEYSAKVRALGGTWDFELYVGNDCVFKKSTSTATTAPRVTFNVQYKVGGQNVTQLLPNIIYNTSEQTGNPYDGNFSQDSWICTLESDKIKNWVPADNNISFKIVGDTQYGPGFNSSYNSTTDAGNVYVYDIDFPAKGETPKIVAFPDTKNWLKEKVPARKEFFKPSNK